MVVEQGVQTPDPEQESALNVRQEVARSTEQAYLSRPQSGSKKVIKLVKNLHQSNEPSLEAHQHSLSPSE